MVPVSTAHPARRPLLLRSCAFAAVSALTLAACSDSGGGRGSASGEPVDLTCAVEDYAADEQFTSPEPMEVSMLWTDWPESPVKDSWQIFDEIEKRTNVRITTTHVPFSDAVEKRSLLISAGDAPTVIPLIYSGDERQYAASGAVLPLSDYLEYMPNFRKYSEDWDLTGMLEGLRQADGKFYMTPGLQEVSVPTFTLIIRKDVFDEVGAPEPDSWEALRTGLELVKAKYPDSLPLADGFEGGAMLNYASHAFGTVAGWGLGTGMFYDEDAGEFVYAATSDSYKEMLEYFHGLAEDGLLDTESFVAPNDGSGTVTEKMASESAFAASGSSGTLQEYATALDAAGVTGYELVQIPPPTRAAADDEPVRAPRGFWNGFMITAQAADDPDLCSTVQFLDWLYYNPDAREMLQWGVEGETYTKAEDGTITLNPEYSFDSFNINSGPGTTDIKKDLGWSSDVLAGSSESRQLKESYNKPEFVTYIDEVLESGPARDPFPPAPLDEIELEQASLLGTPLKDTVDTATLQFILGNRSLDQWDAYVAQLNGQGLPGYVDLLNGARERFAQDNG